MTKDIYVFIEQREGKIQEVSLELLGKAHQLVQQMPNAHFKVVGILLGSNIKSEAQSLIQYGADKVIVCDKPQLQEYSTDLYTDVICKIAKEVQPDSLLIGATNIGRDLAPRVAGRLDTGLTADATMIEVETDTPDSTLLLVTRPAFGGNLFGTIICPNTRPQMASIRPKVFEVPQADASRTGEVVDFDTDVNAESLVKILKKIKLEAKGKDITEANIIVGAGRGAKDYMPLLEEFAQAIGGHVGSSRALVDEGIAKKDIQVGQTGKTVRPQIYIACGISGAAQHVAGMEKSDYIIAINKDPNAAIFSTANIGIVADAKLVVTELLKQLRDTK